MASGDDTGRPARASIGEIGRFPNAVSLRSAGSRLLRTGLHAEAELLLRTSVATARAKRGDVAGEVIEDLARSVLPHSPVEALRLLRVLEAAHPDARPRTSALNLKGRALYELYEIPEAESSFAAALASAKREGNDLYVGYVSLNQAILRFDEGGFDRARELNRAAIRRFEASGEPGPVLFARCNLGVHDLVVGRYDRAIEEIEAVGEGVRHVSNPYLAAFHSFILGELEVLTGDRDRARDHFATSVRQSGLAGNPALRVRALTWKTLLEEVPGERFLRDVGGVAHDLDVAGLRSDSGLLLLLAAEVARSRRLPWQEHARGAVRIFGERSCIDWFACHYRRIVESSLGAPRRPARRALSAFVSRSEEVRRILERVSKLARTDVRLLFEGESGTGKSFLARLVHAEGGKKRPFVVVDCTNLEENLFESKLFGHTRGAFTGAVSDSAGLVEQADGGTLFLDEIGEIPVEIQAKLLYTIEEQRYRPVGARMEKTSSFRVIAATNRDIDAMLEEGSLRRDLYYRIAGDRVRLPPLRDRREDVVPLAELQMERLNRRHGRKRILRPAAWEALARHDWPGNVRELNAVLERAFHLAPGRRIGSEDLGVGRDPADADDLAWDAVRRTHLLRVLRLCRGNVTRAAKILGMNRTTLIYKLKQLDIGRADFDPAHEPGRALADAVDPALRRVADRGTVDDPEADGGGDATGTGSALVRPGSPGND